MLWEAHYVKFKLVNGTAVSYQPTRKARQTHRTRKIGVRCKRRLIDPFARSVPLRSHSHSLRLHANHGDT